MSGVPYFQEEILTSSVVVPSLLRSLLYLKLLRAPIPPLTFQPLFATANLIYQKAIHSCKTGRSTIFKRYGRRSLGARRSLIR